MGVDLVASDAIVAEDLVVPVSPTEGQEGSTKDTEELALGLLVGDPGHCLRLAVRETHLDVVVGSVADEEVVDLVHQTIMLIIASTQTNIKYGRDYDGMAGNGGLGGRGNLRVGL